jgi:uncharacterized membrane protein
MLTCRLAAVDDEQGVVGMADVNLVVMTFDNEIDAGNVMRSLRSLEKSGQMSIEDTAVLVKDQSGKLRVDNEVSGSVETGAVVGGSLGLLLTFMFPVVGIAVGAAGGALVGKVLERGVDGKFVKDVGEELQPGTSALFITGRGSNHEAVLRAIEPYKGNLYQTNLSSELEDELRRVLK